jgi:hypothetical protein
VGGSGGGGPLGGLGGLGGLLGFRGDLIFWVWNEENQQFDQ